MQTYRPEPNRSPDLIRRFLWVAFLVSAIATLFLAFCSRKEPPGPASSSEQTAVEQIDPGGASFDPEQENKSLQTNSERPGFKELDLDQNVYFLLTGLDRRKWEQDPGPGLTDVIMVAFLDPEEDKAGVISIPRDTWVEVPEFGPYKINQAYSLGEGYGYPGGGPGILMETAGDLLGVQIDYYVQVDFDAFVVLVDAVDGVKVNVPQEILVWPNAEMAGDMKRLEPGVQVLPGNLALGYVRTRDTLEGDFGRTKRQQQVLVGLQKKLFSTDYLARLIPRLPGLYRDLATHVETNLSLNQIITLGWIVKDINPQSVQTMAIKEPMVEAGINDRNQYVLYPDTAAVQASWQEMQTINATPIPEPTQEITLEDYVTQENASVAVYNGTSSPGLASEAAEFLIANGINVTAVGNSDKFKDQTTIYDYSGKPHTLQLIFNTMNLDQTRLFYRSDPAVTEDIVIILGTDWALENPLPDF